MHLHSSHPVFLSAIALGIACLSDTRMMRAAEESSPVLRIEPGRVTAHVRPGLYGLMTEEINYSYDGGLYGELIRNRAFTDDPSKPVHWSVVEGEGASAAAALDPSQPLNAAIPTSLRIDIHAASEAAPAGIANDGYWGIPVRANTLYRVSFFAKAEPGPGQPAPPAGFFAPLKRLLAGNTAPDWPVKVALQSADGGTVFAQARVTGVGSGWRRCEAELRTSDAPASAKTRFVITSSRPGTLWLGQVSLFPPTWHGRVNGNRIDLMQKLADLHPGFLRFPGGNYLEGDTIATRFNWKETIGPIWERPGHPSPWKYHSSDGMGLLEFLEWCEDLNMEPVLAVFAGYALKHEYVPAGPGLQPFVQDALDEIEYATGGAGTTWGARRIRDGHPNPFPLTYVEVGNEDWFDKSGSYDGRFAQFFDAIKVKYPKLQIIATTKISSRVPDVIDEHFYRKATQFYSDIHRYDSYSRSGPKIFVGEWATREGSPTPNLNAALGDAAWMTALERNADLVVMDCYAPLFVNVNPGGMQWKTDLIGYDALTSYGSPPYYAHQMYNVNRGDEVVASGLEGGAGLFTNTTLSSASGELFVKVVNSTGTAADVRIEVSGPGSLAAKGRSIVLCSGSPTDTNSIEEPSKVVPAEYPLLGVSASFAHVFPANSVSVLILKTR